MMRGGLVVLAAAGSVLTLGGCSPLPTGGPQPTPTPTVTLTVLTTDEAADVFADTVCTFNAGAREFDVTWRDMDASLRDLQEAAALNSSESEAAREKLDAVVWPDGVAEDVAVVAQFFETRAETLAAVVTAKTVDEINELEVAAPELAGAAADRVEAALGLGEDYCPGDQPAPQPEPATLYAGDLMGTAWYGMDSDGDYTEVHFDPAGPVTVLVKGEALEAEHFDVAGKALSFRAATAGGIVVDYVGAWAEANLLTLEATEQSTGATWTIDLQPIT